MSSYSRSHPLLRPGQGEREFLPCVTHTASWCASFANCIVDFPHTHINARFLSHIDNFGSPPYAKIYLDLEIKGRLP